MYNPKIIRTFAVEFRSFASMAHLHLEYIGPVKAIDLDLKRFNVFIGPQSSGKSTIAKLISFCTWIEKRAVTTLSDKLFANADDFKEQAENYHKMHGYFNADSRLEYQSDHINILYNANEFSLQLLDKLSYKRKKIIYIPSDRNMVAMPELERMVVGTNTNLRSFTFDWFDARNMYDKSHRLNILDLNMEYYYDKDAKHNKDKIIHTNGKTYDITLSDASSGLQSVTPLTLLLNYYSDQYFANYGKTTSYEKELEQKMLNAKIETQYPLLDESFRNKLFEDSKGHSETYNTILRLAYQGQNSKRVLDRHKLYCQLITPVTTDFIIEEPEQNLFPSTQAQLINYLLTTCNGTDRRHSFTITTHSPYILTQLNILLFAGILEKQGKKEQVKDIVNPLAVIMPEEIGVFAVQIDGTIESVLNEQTSLISQNYLDSISEDLSVTFQNLYRMMF